MPKVYSSARYEQIKDFVRQINKAKILPHGYSTSLSKKLDISLNAARETLKGRSAKPAIVEQIIVDAEQQLGLNPSNPKTEDYSDWSISDLVEHRLLPNRFGEQVAEMVGCDRYTVYQISEGRKRSQRIEEALRQLAGDNKEREFIHRLERIMAAIPKEYPSA